MEGVACKLKRDAKIFGVAVAENGGKSVVRFAQKNNTASSLFLPR